MEKSPPDAKFQTGTTAYWLRPFKEPLLVAVVDYRFSPCEGDEYRVQIILGGGFSADWVGDGDLITPEEYAGFILAQ